MAESKRKAVVIGVSGASSSGKTTLSRLLRDIFPNTFVLHEDDFYKPEKDIPVTDGLLDWDCAEALVIPDIITSLKYIQEHGEMPTCKSGQPAFDSKEDKNDLGNCPVSESVIADLKAKVSEWIQIGHPGHDILISGSLALRLCIFDGFLLYSESMASIQQHMDVKFFLRVSYTNAKVRRESRSGYATIEGFWEDPPMYVDRIVWPNYVKGHKWMFKDENVEGEMKEQVIKEWNIKVRPEKGPDVDMETTLRWAVETLMEALERFSCG